MRKEDEVRIVLLIFLSESTRDPTVEKCLLPVDPRPAVRNVTPIGLMGRKSV